MLLPACGQMRPWELEGFMPHELRAYLQQVEQVKTELRAAAKH